MYKGPKGSGSPPHFHRDTVNGLVYRIKHWYMWPPAEAFLAFNIFKTGLINIITM